MKLQHMTLPLLLLTALLTASCASVEDAGTVTTAAGTEGTPVTETETAEPRALDTLAAADFGEHAFTVMACNDGANNRHYDIETAGEETGDLFNDLVYRRNRAVEEKYNIKLVCANEGYEDVTAIFRQQVQGGLTDYDLYFGDSHVAKLAAEGYFTDLNAIDTLDLSNPWWSRNARESLSVDGKIYFMTGDINPTTLMAGGGLAFNKVLFANNDIPYPYDTVREGAWTIDKMLAICKDAGKDVNGDGNMTIDADMYGFTSWCAASPYALFFGMGGRMSRLNAEGIPTLDWDTEKMSTIYDKMYTLIHEYASYFVTDVAQYDTNFMCFSDGHAFFNQIAMLTVDRNLRDMEDDYGILPLPKLDESQESYYAYVNAAMNSAMIPSNAENLSRTGTITEALAAAAYDIVTPSLYEIITKSKNVRDAESAEMVSIITQNIVFDPFYLNLLDGFSFLQEQLVAKRDNIASAMESKRKAAEKALEKLVDAFASIE